MLPSISPLEVFVCGFVLRAMVLLLALSGRLEIDGWTFAGPWSHHRVSKGCGGVNRVLAVTCFAEIMVNAHASS